jgi:hypothetical protein
MNASLQKNSIKTINPRTQWHLMCMYDKHRGGSLHEKLTVSQLLKKLSPCMEPED